MNYPRTPVSLCLSSWGIRRLSGQKCPALEQRPLFLGLLLLQVLLTGCVTSGAWPQASRPERTFRVSGYVLDSVSHKPAPGVLVKSHYSGYQAHTDASGHFVLQLPRRRHKKGSGSSWKPCSSPEVPPFRLIRRNPLRSYSRVPRTSLYPTGACNPLICTTPQKLDSLSGVC